MTQQLRDIAPCGTAALLRALVATSARAAMDLRICFDPSDPLFAEIHTAVAPTGEFAVGDR